MDRSRTCRLDLGSEVAIGEQHATSVAVGDCRERRDAGRQPLQVTLPMQLRASNISFRSRSTRVRFPSSAPLLTSADAVRSSAQWQLDYESRQLVSARHSVLDTLPTPSVDKVRSYELARRFGS